MPSAVISIFSAAARYSSPFSAYFLRYLLMMPDCRVTPEPPLADFVFTPPGLSLSPKPPPRYAAPAMAR
jgi:hypothetical protein